jgi:PhnB protein
MEGYHAICPYMVVKGAAGAIEFYKKAFNAIEMMRITGTDGLVMHAEIKIDDSVVMITDETPNWPMIQSPPTVGGTPLHIHLYTEDVDGLAKQAIEAGAVELMPVTDQGEDRRGGLVDPFGHVWWVATRIKDISREEMMRQYEASKEKELVA